MLATSFQDRKREQRLVAARALVAALAVVLAMGILLIRLVHLQIDRHAHFSVLSKDNRVKIQPVPPARGLIHDARGVLLAENHASFALDLIVEKVDDLERTIDRLSEIMTIDERDLARFERLKRQRMRFQGVPIRLNLTPAEVARFSVDGHHFPGVEIRAELVRSYPHTDLTAHVLGYVGRINEQELTRIDQGNYAGTQFIGKGGVEKAHEPILHGQVGYRQVEVNARGRVLRTLESTAPVPGQDLLLYLDIGLQRAAMEALGERRGAVVAIDPRTGGVLALVSKPGFDPNPFVEGIGQRDYQALLHAPDKPLFNRAIRGQYPPGSTIKPLVGLGGLVSGITNAQRQTFCPGHFSLPGQSHKFRCWNKRGHGSLNLKQSVVQSCDVYFYDLAARMGIDRLHDFLAEFGFGAPTGIDLADELGGLLPSRDWKQRVRKQGWYPGETLIVGIGQGSFLATPLQLAAAAATIANRGLFIRPRVARAARFPGAESASEFPVVAHPVEVGDHQYWDHIVESMAEVVEGERGTARRIRSPSYRIAGKTGTSQVFTIGQNQKYDASKLPEHLHDHALFIAFAPVEDPRIAIAVLVENGGGGSSTAAPVARRVIDAWLGGTPLPSEEKKPEGG